MNSLLTPQHLHEYQKECVIHQLSHSDSMLWLQMGLGKTVITLTTIVDRMRANQVKKTLIFGPLRVIHSVWSREARGWSHTKHLRFSIMHGTRDKRLRSLFTDADIYLCNYENMNWLAEQLDHYYLSQGKPLPFQMVVYDEVSKLKNSTTRRMAGGSRDRIDKRGEPHTIKITGWRKMINEFEFRTGLTGTPASNGYLDLHGQYLAVDGGQRLGEYITHFKDSYFTSDYNGWKYTPTEEGEQWIEHHISDITIKMDAKDYLDIPPRKVVNMMVDLPPKARKAYQEVEKDLFTVLDSGKEIELFSKTAISNKCLQFCNGQPYLNPHTHEFEALHDAKLDALEDVLEEAGGQPVLCSYTFVSDAERIMKRFKQYKPVNLTAAKSAATEGIIDRWNSGKIKLLIGHPACLHPSTQVLTELRGWIRLIDVKQGDKVFDGVEFVRHDGCSYSGYKPVVKLFDITMTPDHKLMIGGDWQEASSVRDCSDVRKKASYEYEGDDEYLSEMLTVRHGFRDTPSERDEAQQVEAEALSTLHQGHLSQPDRDQDLADLAGDEEPGKRHLGSKLCGSRNRHVRGVGRILRILQGYARRVCRPLDHRTSGCEQRLLEGQLYLGDDVKTAVKQEVNPVAGLSGQGCSLGRAVPHNRIQQDDAHHEVEQGDDRRRSRRGCQEFTVRERTEGEEKSHVYDLVNCGPRNRFLIRNDAGEVFISHNSMGHGIDGLQESGTIAVWFGMNWSLELYDQFNGRLDRQGQTQPVSIIRILCKDTVDLAVADAIDRKNDDQEGLKRSIDRYRKGVTTNELEVNFY